MTDTRPAEITISSTGDGTFQLCPRRWAFTFPFKMPTLKRPYFTLGSVLHACVERYLWAPDGIVPIHAQWTPGDALYGQKPGDPIDLYPEAPGIQAESEGNRWYEVRERDGTWQTLPVHKRDDVKTMVANGIANGTIVHLAGGVPEVKITLPLVKGAVYTSLVDYSSKLLCIVHDHKTFSASYKKSAKDLSVDGQLLAYGYWMLTQRPDLDRVQLRHNQFSKQSLAASVTYAEEEPGYPYVSRERVEANWARIQAIGQQAVDLVANYPGPEEWEKIPGPTPGSGACNAYGKPCDFLAICNKQQTVAEWKKRAEAARTLAASHSSFFESLHKPMALSPLSNGPSSRRMAPAPAAPKPKLLSKGDGGDFRLNVYEIVQAGGTARAVECIPWRNPDCKDCGGVGVMANLDVCGACEDWTVGQSRDDDLPEHWEVGFGGDGKWYCNERGEAAAPKADAEPEEGGEWEEVDEPIEAPKRKRGRPRKGPVEPEPKRAVLPPRTMPPAPEPPPLPTPAKSAIVLPTAKAAPRPAKPDHIVDAILVLGSVPATDKPMYDLARAIQDAKCQLSDSQGAGSYFALDTWKRRDMLAQMAVNMLADADKQGAAILYHQAPDPECQGLLSAIRGMVSVVVDCGAR